ncbi:MAG: heavy metal translocating P-type ATPase [Lentisphaerae bacterium]|nr:heavy metal translocating P-type ATPase [Lentisphaerota bacterium]
MNKSKNTVVTDPVCKMQFPVGRSAAQYEYNSTIYYFCNPRCKERFAADPELYLKSTSPAPGCCCCSEAFEDDQNKIDRRLRSLRNGFIISAVITVLLAGLEHCSYLDLYLRQNLQWLLASLAVFGAGGFLLKNGIKSLSGFRFNMFTLISMGIMTAYIFSVYALFFGFTLPESLLNGNGLAKLHFVPAAMITTLVILGQYLESRASRGASRAIRALMELVPPTAHRISECGCVKDVALDQIKKGDCLKVMPHEKIPVDGVVIAGCSSVDESMLSGEALPIAKQPGDRLAAGTENGESVLEMRSEAVGRDTLLGQIVDLVRAARNTRLPIQKLADKVSAIFVPTVLAIAVAALLIWGLAVKDWSMALGCFTSVLLAACPCALGLAAPLAVMVGIGRGARCGILIKNASTLEDLRKVDIIMLDKTGTLTENKPEITEVYIDDAIGEKEFYQTLLALEQNSLHPLAHAVKNMPQAAQFNHDLPPVEKFISIPGQGVKGVCNNAFFLLGSPEFMRQNQLDLQSFLNRIKVDITALERSVIMLGCDKKLLGMLVASDRIRPDAAGVIAEIKQHRIEPILLSGDNPTAVKSVALKLGIEEFYGALSPQQKLEKVKAMQAFGRRVAMVGDGVNDAAALAAAEVGIAMGSGTDAALENAGVTLLAGNIGKLGALLHLSRAVNETIKVNLYLAFAYNMLLIPFAAGAFYSLVHFQITPAVSAIAMSGSCLLVVSNSLRLWNLKLNK